MIVGMALNMQYGFKQGFFNYRKSVDDQFNKSLVSTLESYYQENTSWDGLENNKKLWHEILNLSSAEPQKVKRLRPPPRRQNKENIPKFRARNNHNPPLPRRNSDKKNRKRDNNDLPPRRQEEKFRPRLLAPVVLLTVQKEYLVGMNEWQDKVLKYHEIKKQ